jgi:hypothetical protein
MLDEYGHLLKGSGLSAEQAAERFKEVTGIQTVNVGCQFFEDVKARTEKNSSTLRCHYAVPLGNQKADEQGRAGDFHLMIRLKTNAWKKNSLQPTRKQPKR